MEFLYNPENISKLCDFILHNRSQQNVDFTSCVKGLKYICHGLPEEKKLSFLTSEEKLVSILQLPKFYEFLALQPNDYICIADALLTNSDLSSEICIALKLIISDLVSKNLSNKSKLAKKLFNHKDFSLLPVDVVEEIVTLESSELELKIIHLYQQQLLNKHECDTPWRLGPYQCLIHWCSRSTKLYRLVTTIMNEMLMFVKYKSTLINIIGDFVSNVYNSCAESGLDFIRHYPENLQPLVGLMSLDLNGLTTANVENLGKSISVEISYLQNKDKRQALMVLTHFRKWENILPILK